MTVNPSGWRPAMSASEAAAPSTYTGNRALMLEEPLIFEIAGTSTTGIDIAAPARQGGGLALDLVGRGRAADGVHGAHQRISARAVFRAVICASVVVSVVATSRTSSMPAAGARRP